MKTITATAFKAQCLAILDEVAATGEQVTVLKRGKAVARLVPAISAARYPQLGLLGTVRILGDVVAPAAPAEDWEAVSGGEP